MAEIEPIRKRFHILPIISVVKHTNPLSEEARKTFDYNWEKFYTIEIGWLWWDNFN